MSRKSEAAWGYLFVSPLYIGFAVFLIGPLLFSLYISLTHWDVLSSPTWAGLDNYRTLFTDDPVIGKAFYNTVYLMVGIPVGIAGSLLLALLMNQPLRGVAIFRTIYFLPVISSAAAVSILWRWLYNPQFGLINYLLRLMHVPGPDWLGSEAWAKPALILMGVWGGLGFNMLLYLAALQGVPKQLYEAAQIDGASAWQRLRHITWPLITPTTFFITVTAVIGTFQSFAQIHLMTRGNGPGAVGGGPRYATTTVIYHLWLNAFSYFKMGYASAIAWLLALVILACTLLQFWVARRWVHYED